MRTRGDQGETLVELVIAVAILGVGVVALLSGLATAATTGGLHRRQALEVQYLRDAAEAVQDVAYTPCASTYPTGLPQPAGYTFTITVAVSDANGAAFAAPCNDTGLQQVTITIAQPDTRVRSETLTLVKRQPCSNGGATPC